MQGPLGCSNHGHTIAYPAEDVCCVSGLHDNATDCQRSWHPAVFDMSAINFLSAVTAPIEVIASTGTVLSRATGFFHSRNGESINLVTNWHVVTGRHPEAPQNSLHGAVPTNLRLLLHKRVDQKKSVISLSRKVSLDIPINSHDGDKPTWFEHPNHMHSMDVVVIEVPNDALFAASVQYNVITEHPAFDDSFEPEVMGDAFVVGYPWGLTGGDAVLPLYKRGSVASEPFVDQAGLPRFLIDCRTASGLSGAPVICSHTGILGLGAEGQMLATTTIGTTECFAGVYSGRLRSVGSGSAASGDVVSEIGIVWKKNALDEIVEGGVEGTRLSDL